MNNVIVYRRWSSLLFNEEQLFHIYIKLIVFFGLLPAIIARNKRRFSKLKIVKSRLRATMTNDRLQALLLRSIETDVIDALTDEELIAKWMKNKKTSHLNCSPSTLRFSLFLAYFVYENTCITEVCGLQILPSGAM